MKRRNKIWFSTLSIATVSLSLSTVVSCANLNENTQTEDDWYCKWGKLEDDGTDSCADVYPYKTQVEKINESGKMESVCVTYWKIDGCEWYAGGNYHYPSSCLVGFVDQTGMGNPPGLQFVYDPNFETNHKFSILISYIQDWNVVPSDCKLAEFIYPHGGNIFPNNPKNIWLHFDTPQLICEEKIQNWDHSTSSQNRNEIYMPFFAVNFSKTYITFSEEDAISVVSHDNRLIINEWGNFAVDRYNRWTLYLVFDFSTGFEPPIGLYLWPLTVSFKFQYQNIDYEVSSDCYISSFNKG